MIRFVPWLAAVVGFFPVATFAHTRWFAEGALPPYVSDEPTALYLLMWAFAAVVAVLVGVYLERKQYAQGAWIAPRAPHAFERAASTFAMIVGAFFVIAGTHEYLFSPSLSLETGTPQVFILLQVFIGLAFLIGFYSRLAALVLLALWLVGLGFFGLVPMLENVWVLSTALFVLIMGNDYFSLIRLEVLKRHTQKLHAYALPLLRLGTGATLLVLGFSEKILHPELGINFLEQYHWNFMDLLGFPYSDYLFTLSAGSVEALLGLIFMLGVVTRLNALIVAGFFTIPLFILGPIELAGHLPHFTAVVILLFFGAGERLRLIMPMAHGRKRSVSGARR